MAAAQTCLDAALHLRDSSLGCCFFFQKKEKKILPFFVRANKGHHYRCWITLKTLDLKLLQHVART